MHPMDWTLWRRSIQPTWSIPMKKIPASEATRKRLEEVFSGEQIDPSRIVREATRLMIEQVLEAEVEQAVERWPRKSGHGDKWKLCHNPSGSTPGKAEGP